MAKSRRGSRGRDKVGPASTRLLHLHRFWRKGSVCSPRVAPRLAQQLLPVLRAAEAGRPPPAAVAPTVPTAWSLPPADELYARTHGLANRARRARGGPRNGSATRVSWLAAAAASAARALERSAAFAASAAAAPPVPLGGFEPSQQQCPPDARNPHGIRLECPWCAHPTRSLAPTCDAAPSCTRGAHSVTARRRGARPAST